jgi:hypothetical protein
MKTVPFLAALTIAAALVATARSQQPKLDSSFDGEDSSGTKVAADNRRIKEASEEEYRKQLLAYAESGLNQELVS